MPSEENRFDRTRLATSAPGSAGNLDDIGTSLKLNQAVARLTIVDGPGTGQSWEIRNTSMLVGRDDSNHIQLNFGDDTVHRKAHVAIEFRNGQFHLHNIKRTNPVVVNGENVESIRTVAIGDLIRVGSTTFRLESL